MKTTANNPCNILNENSSISILKWIGELFVQLVLDKLNLWLDAVICS